MTWRCKQTGHQWNISVAEPNGLTFIDFFTFTACTLILSTITPAKNEITLWRFFFSSHFTPANQGMIYGDFVRRYTSNTSLNMSNSQAGCAKTVCIVYEKYSMWPQIFSGLYLYLPQVLWILVQPNFFQPQRAKNPVAGTELMALWLFLWSRVHSIRWRHHHLSSAAILVRWQHHKMVASFRFHGVPIQGPCVMNESTYRFGHPCTYWKRVLNFHEMSCKHKAFTSA